MEIPNTGASLYKMPRDDQERATFSLFRVSHINPDLTFGPDNLYDGIKRLCTESNKYEALLNIHAWLALGISALVSYHPDDGEPEFDLERPEYGD